MKKFERLDEAKSPDGTVLTLYRHDGAYTIRLDGVELMSTRRHHSEEKLAELACASLEHQAGARVLIGGLGFGFTLRGALRTLGSDARIVVAELVEGVINWNRHPDYALAGDALDDPRVELRHADVLTVLKEGSGVYNAIMLDVDNGAEALTTSGNARLYRDVGIHLAAGALRPGGCLAYWSAQGDASFERALRGAGLRVDITRVRAHTTSGFLHTVYVARRVA